MSKINELKEILQLLDGNAASAPSGGNIWDEMIGKRCVIRTWSAGVFLATVEKVSPHGNQGFSAVLTDCIRIHGWSGAASLSQMAMDGTKNPENCRFAMPTARHLVVGVIEMIPATPSAIASIEGAKSWKI